ncbi:helix-turn-helix domain-containing protein [Actinoplanes auranticolor]|uniref:HTH merR-type domain-containing protein n=1 Tax=Actinoplanes auranticolor TaxID=47988 RepID=A0A919S7G8_9ACTN|nr:MerR family transcriptional regulator [Actinoplanes auranticolor]GIM66223.1 hypothetical protein Aau02nite_22220 [Actinoplanes auranticolor]
MPWSTRELAELTGTTVNTIRHYHRLGLLEEPERRHNGYKQYGDRELGRLLSIRRLVELGVPLARIGEAGTDGTVPPEILRQVDAGLAADIERLVRARTDIATILRNGAQGPTATISHSMDLGGQSAGGSADVLACLRLGDGQPLLAGPAAC